MTVSWRHEDWESSVSRGSDGERVSGSHWVQPGRMWYGGKWSSWCSHGSSGGADAIWRRDAMDQRHSRWRSNCQNGTPAGGGDGQICRRPAELPKLDTRFQEKDKKRRIYVCDWCRCIVQFGTRASGFEGRFVDVSWPQCVRLSSSVPAPRRYRIRLRTSLQLRPRARKGAGKRGTCSLAILKRLRAGARLCPRHRI